jgi:hypothetical protein
MLIRSLSTLCLLWSAVVPRAANAKPFSNSYVAFAVPDDWSCDLDDTEWTCEPPKDANGKVSMLIVLTAKCVGPSDSPQLYLSHLEEVSRRPGITTVVKPKERLFGGLIWLDGTLGNSEIKNYDTRYLVRNEGDIGVAVTFSWHAGTDAQATPISDKIAKSVVVNSAMARPELRAGALPVCSG